jgi:hypothetical protein
MRLSPKGLTFLFELCLLGLASFSLETFCFGPFWRFYSKVGQCGTKLSSCLQSGKRQAMCEHRKIRSKWGKFDLGGVWMMVSIQASGSGSNFVIFLQIYACFDCVVINHQKGGDCSKHGPTCHLFELILVIHVNTSNGTNHIV